MDIHIYGEDIGTLFYSIQWNTDYFQLQILFYFLGNYLDGKLVGTSLHLEDGTRGILYGCNHMFDHYLKVNP